MTKILNQKSLFILVLISVLFKLYLAWNTDMFFDELMVLSRSYWDSLSIFKYSLHTSFHPPLTYLPGKLLYLFDQLTVNKLRFISIIFSLIPFIYFTIDISRNSRNKFLVYLLVFNAYVFSFSLITTNYIFAYSLFLIFIHFYIQNKSINTLLWLTGIIFFINYLAGFLCIVLMALKSIKNKELKKIYYYFYLNIPFVLSIFMFFVLQYYWKPFEIFSQIFLIISSIIFIREKTSFALILKSLALFYVIHLLETQVFENSINVDFNSVMLFSQILILFFFLVKPSGVNILKVLAIAVIQFMVFKLNDLGSDYYVILSGIYFYSLVLLFKREYLSPRYFPIQLIIFWISQKIIYNFSVYDRLNEFMTAAPEHLIAPIKWSPYLILIGLCLVSSFIIRDKIKHYLKENPNYLYLIGAALIFCFTIVTLHFYGRTIYARYLFFTIAILVYLSSFFISKIENNKSIITLLSIYLASNFIFTPSQLTYFDTLQTSSMYKKITENGKYSSSIYFFTKNYSWHEYYFRDFKIRENFDLFTFKDCNEETIDEVMTMAGRNSFISAYDFECPELKKKIMEICPKYDSQCFDLKAEHATVVLKMFEPEGQQQEINALEKIFPK